MQFEIPNCNQITDSDVTIMNCSRITFERPWVNDTYAPTSINQQLLRTGETLSIPPTMYTWTDNTDKKLKPNKANMTAFKNLTLWFREINGDKMHNFQIK